MTTPYLRAAACCAVLALSGLAGPSHAFADDEARRAILDLREKHQVLQGAHLQLADQMDALREQNARLTGQLEQLSNELEQQKRGSRELFTDLDRRLAALESQTLSLDGKEISVSAEERRRYDLALRLFSDGKFAESQKLLQGLVDDYPDSDYLPSSLYWLGNALFAQGSFSASAERQKQLIAQFPQDARVPEAKLSLASSLSSLGRKKEARETLQQIQRDYPDSAAAKTAGDRLRALN